MSLIVRLFFWGWFAAAVAAGHLLVLQRMAPVATPVVSILLAAGLVWAYFRISAVRTWVDSLDLRALVLVHLVRFLGFHLLLLYHRGELPRAFALPAGIGDIIVATMALPVAFAPLTDAQRRRAVFIWNVFGFMSALLVLGSSIRMNLTAPWLVRSFTHLPLSLLPTFIVPLVLATHAIVHIRLGKEKAEEKG